MTRATTVAVMHGQVDSTAVLRNIEGMTDELADSIEGSVLYPYFGFSARCTVPTMIGKRTMTVDCLVDGINGHGATADSFATEQTNASDEVLLQSRITDEDAQRTARRTLMHRLGRQLKMIASFDVQLESAGTIYKRFWIIRVGNDRVIADSVTGHVHPLSATAA
jgi:hypothetical protein